MMKFIEAVGRLLSLLVGIFETAEKRRNEREHQQSHDDIERNPAGEFAARYGMRDEMPGTDPPAAAPDTAKHHD